MEGNTSIKSNFESSAIKQEAVISVAKYSAQAIELGAYASHEIRDTYSMSKSYYGEGGD